ncbi:hypothetical protein [Cellulomonas hominis]|uniref:hypothetical protein n=1 Tax=Cellulomonas hominis TaxID=156981 RepID=UPI001B90DACE|nr:hypothetical protein [Cellulomonas hominis]VTR78609.1 hypothetical protein CHMI_03392 [Cellulomonas hominis]
MPDDSRLDLSALTRAADDLLSVRRVFGEPYEHEGTLVVPVAKVMGGHAAADAHGDARLGLRRGARGGAAGPGGAPEPTAPAAEVPADDLPEQAGDGGSGAPAGSPEGAARGLWHGRPGHGLGGARPSGRGGAQADAGAFAARVKPLGVYVIAADGVRWQPALDLNRVILGGQIVGAVSVLALSWALRRRRR